MKKSKYIEIAEIVVVLVTVTALIVWGYDQTTSQVTLYSKGEKVGNTGFYFAGFTYMEAPHPTPLPFGASSSPHFTPHLVLTVVFKPTSKNGPGIKF
jgi:hypothetical protein